MSEQTPDHDEVTAEQSVQDADVEAAERHDGDASVDPVEEAVYGEEDSVTTEEPADVHERVIGELRAGDTVASAMLANGIHLSAWTGEEVSLADFDEQRYLAELNQRIRDEGKFEERN